MATAVRTGRGGVPPRPTTWRERLGALRNLPPFLGMVWRTSRLLTVTTLVVLSIYWKKGRLKAEIGVAQGKVAHDKRADLKKRATDRETEREVARFNRRHR